jgi:arginyl-tRNA synthetase
VTCSGARRSSRGSSHRRPSCASRTGCARYLEELAATFHKFYDECRGAAARRRGAGDLHRARLLLVEATRTVVANGLGLVGVSAPDRM